MLARFRWRLLPALLLFAALPAVAAKDPEWIEGRSSHFHVFSNAKAKQVQQITQELEEFRHLLVAMFPGLRLDPPIPTTVLLFKNEKTLRPYQPLTPQGKSKDILGYYQPGKERMYLVVDLSRGIARETAFHEYLHLILAMNFESIPVWLDEGLAMFYQRTEIDGLRFSLGFPQTDYWLRLRRSKLIPLEVLTEVDHDSEHYNVPDRRQVFYGQSWLLVHYLMAGDGGKRQGQLTRFMQELRRGAPQAEALQQACGADFKQMRRHLEDYLTESSVSYYKGKLLQAAAKAPVEFQPLETARAEAHLADLWINSGRVDEAEKALQKLVASGATVPDVHFRLGRIAMYRRDVGEAVVHFRAALEQQPEDIGLRYYTALALTMQRFADSGPGGPEGGADEIIALLSPILEQKADFPSAYELLVQARLSRNDPPEEMIPLLERVRELLPQRRDFDLLLAHSYLKSERLDDAEKLLESVVGDSKNETEIRQAKEWLQRIRDMRDWAARRQQLQAAPEPERAEPLLREGGPREPGRANYPSEPPATAPPAAPPRVEYLRGTLVNVECSGDTAIIAVQPETKKKEPAAEPVRLAVRSRSRLLLIEPTDSGRALECGPAGIPVGINYTVRPDEPGIAGVTMTIEFLKSLR